MAHNKTAAGNKRMGHQPPTVVAACKASDAAFQQPGPGQGRARLLAISIPHNSPPYSNNGGTNQTHRRRTAPKAARDALNPTGEAAGIWQQPAKAQFARNSQNAELICNNTLTAPAMIQHCPGPRWQPVTMFATIPPFNGELTHDPLTLRQHPCLSAFHHVLTACWRSILRP